MRIFIWKRNGKGKEYDFYRNILIFEGEYLNGKRHGKGKEYDYKGELKYEGEYLIECFCDNLVIIYEPLNEKIYAKIDIKGDAVSACFSQSEDKKNDYLCISNTKPDNYIEIYDLCEKKEIKKIYIKSCIYHIISWSDRFIIVADSDNMGFDVVDIYEGKIISRYVGHEKKGVKCVKKLKIGQNEYLFSGGKDGYIKMWKSEKNFIGEITTYF